MSTSSTNEYQLPALFASYKGLINDLDAHEAIPVSHWREEFGSAVGQFVEAQMKLVFNPNANKDEAPINAHNVWNLKMEQAPGAFDVRRRLEVIDFVGIDRQIIFPGGLGQQSIYFYNKADDPGAFKAITTDRKQYAHKFPHFEGGRKPMEDFAGSLKGQRPEVIRKFLVDNAKQIMPNL
jgi:hypothetical protein